MRDLARVRARTSCDNGDNSFNLSEKVTSLPHPTPPPQPRPGREETYHGVVALKRLKRELLPGLQLGLLQLAHFRRKDGLGRCGRVNAVGLDRNHVMAAVVQVGLGFFFRQQGEF